MIAMYSEDGEPHIEIAVFKVHATAAAYHPCCRTLQAKFASLLATHAQLREHTVQLVCMHQTCASNKKTTACSLTH